MTVEVRLRVKMGVGVGVRGAKVSGSPPRWWRQCTRGSNRRAPRRVAGSELGLGLGLGLGSGLGLGCSSARLVAGVDALRLLSNGARGRVGTW